MCVCVCVIYYLPIMVDTALEPEGDTTLARAALRFADKETAIDTGTEQVLGGVT